MGGNCKMQIATCKVIVKAEAAAPIAGPTPLDVILEGSAFDVYFRSTVDDAY
jgi:hypothetical protein